MQSFLAKKLSQLNEREQQRALALPSGVDFSSNDYLKFSEHPFLRQAAIKALEAGISLGSGGSRLLRGHHPEHEALETYAASFFETEQALFFANGFLANQGLLSALLEPESVILCDERIHASMWAGITQGRGKSYKIPHLDLNAYEEHLKTIRQTHKGPLWIAVESVFSMDGNIAPIEALLTLAERFEAVLIVDEAHSTGIFGASGRGLTEGLSSPFLITVHTCGKALGVAGALVCGSSLLISFLINRCRPFIFSTSPPPLQAILVKSALELLQRDPQPRAHLWSLMRHTTKTLEEKPSLKERVSPDAPHAPSPIIPIVLGENQKAVLMAQRLQNHGFDVRAVRPPTVPQNTARLRISLNAGLKHAMIDDLFSLISKLLLEDPFKKKGA